MKMTRTQLAIQQYLEEEKLEKQKRIEFPKVKEKVRSQVQARPEEITFVDQRKFIKSITCYDITSSDKQKIYEYVLESPKANQHYWNFTHGKKKDFSQLVINMTR